MALHLATRVVSDVELKISSHDAASTGQAEFASKAWVAIADTDVDLQVQICHGQ